MTFSSKIFRMVTTDGGRRLTYGSFTNGGSDTGGNIDTGLTKVTDMSLQHGATAAIADHPSVNETMTEAAPADGTAMTIVTTQAKNGYWAAWGY